MTSVHLTNAYHPTSGGIRTFYHALLQAAAGHRRRVVLIVPGDRTEQTELGPFGCIYTLESPRAPAFDRRYRIILPHKYFPGLAAPIVRILEKERPVLVEISDKYSLLYLAAMLRKRWHPRVPRPVLVGFSTERFDDNMAAYLSRSPMAQRFTRWYLRHVYGPPFDAHVVASEYVAAELRAALYDRPPGFIRVCPLGADTDEFAPQRASPATRRRLLARVSGGSESVLLLYAGRLSPEKNIGLLVDTLRLLSVRGERDYRLVVAGDGPLSTWLAEQADGPLAGRLTLLGSLDRATLAECCASCDVFVHPNPREPFGIGPLEAMASGVPVVVPNGGGVLEYASPDNAWVVPPTPQSFADAVAAAALGDAGRVARAIGTARALSWPRVMERFFQLYDQLAGELGRLRRLDAVVTAR